MITAIDLVKIRHPAFLLLNVIQKKTVVLSSSELSKGYNSVVQLYKAVWVLRMWNVVMSKLSGQTTWVSVIFPELCDLALILKTLCVLHMQHRNNNCTSLLGVTVRIKWISTHKGLEKADRHSVSAQWVWKTRQQADLSPFITTQVSLLSSEPQAHSLIREVRYHLIKMWVAQITSINPRSLLIVWLIVYYLD